MKICPSCHTQFEDRLNFCPQDNQVLEYDLTSIIGTTLDGQYHVEELLGRGGMGAVYRARHAKLGDVVAVKIMPAHLGSNPEYQKRFIREGQAARAFRHPNAVTVHDLRETADGTIYMVQEYVEGETLHDALKHRERFTPSEALEILEPVMRALQAAHEAGIVHRDLKPDNIMIGDQPDGERLVKLLDLGIAKFQNDTELTALTQVGQILGTPYYMSPEQWEAENDIDQRADIYSMGVILYELVSGRKPFVGKTLESLAYQHSMGTPPDLEELCPSIPKTFCRVVHKALEKRRENRQWSMEVLLTQLRDSLATKDAEPKIDPDSVKTLAFASDEIRPRGGETVVQVPVPTRGPSKRADEEREENSQSPKPNEPLAKDRTTGLKRFSTGVLFAVTALVIVIGGYTLGFRSGSPPPPLPPKPKPEPVELGRWWIEAGRTASQTTRLSGRPVLSTGDKFKIHFLPNADGYLFIVGPGRGNIPTTFLTSKPVAESGLTTNAVKKGQEIVFPKDLGIELDANVGTDTFSVFFSSSPLGGPSFLGTEAGKPLNAADQAALKTFLNSVVPSDDKELIGQDPYTIVRVSETPKTDFVVSFDIKIDHK